jgi:hypothetical protein
MPTVFGMVVLGLLVVGTAAEQARTVDRQGWV